MYFQQCDTFYTLGTLKDSEKKGNIELFNQRRKHLTSQGVVKESSIEEMTVGQKFKKMRKSLPRQLSRYEKLYTCHL